MQRQRQPTLAAAQMTAFTIAEVLVCLGIIGLLAALVLPAVQRAREAARRVQCRNNLRQVGIALHAFEGARAQFPRGGDMVLDGSGGKWPRSHAPHLYLLPYVDQSPLYGRIDLLMVAERTVGVVAGVNDANEAAKQVTLPTFLCPSDGGALATRRNNYRANVGATPFPRFANVLPVPPLPGNGAFYPVAKQNLPQSFTDGLSNTVGFSERIAGDGDKEHYSPARDFCLVSVNDLNALYNSPNFVAQYIETCASLTDPNPPHDSTWGQFWFYAGLPDTWYNHLLPPNHPIPDCGESAGLFSSGVITARSLHSGGVHCLMMDGAVKFVGNSVDLHVWRAAATRNGNEPSRLD